MSFISVLWKLIYKWKAVSIPIQFLDDMVFIPLGYCWLAELWGWICGSRTTSCPAAGMGAPWNRSKERQPGDRPSVVLANASSNRCMFEQIFDIVQEIRRGLCTCFCAKLVLYTQPWEYSRAQSFVSSLPLGLALTRLWQLLRRDLVCYPWGHRGVTGGVGQKGCGEFRGGWGRAETAQPWWEGCDCQKTSTSVACCRFWCACWTHTALEGWGSETEPWVQCFESPHQEQNPPCQTGPEPWLSAQPPAASQNPCTKQQQWAAAFSIRRAASASLADGGQKLIFIRGRVVFSK